MENIMKTMIMMLFLVETRRTSLTSYHLRRARKDWGKSGFIGPDKQKSLGIKLSSV